MFLHTPLRTASYSLNIEEDLKIYRCDIFFLEKTEAYLGPSQASMMKCFCGNNGFTKKLHLRISKGTKYTSEAFQQEEKLQSIFFGPCY